MKSGIQAVTSICDTCFTTAYEGGVPAIKRLWILECVSCREWLNWRNALTTGGQRGRQVFLHSLSCEMKCEMLRKYRIAIEVAAMQNRSMFKKKVISKVTIWKIGQISAMMIRIFGTNYDY